MKRMFVALAFSAPGFVAAFFLITHFAHLGTLTTPFVISVAVVWLMYIVAAIFLPDRLLTRK